MPGCRNTMNAFALGLVACGHVPIYLGANGHSFNDANGGLIEWVTSSSKPLLC